MGTRFLSFEVTGQDIPGVDAWENGQSMATAINGEGTTHFSDRAWRLGHGQNTLVTELFTDDGSAFFVCLMWSATLTARQEKRFQTAYICHA